MRARLAPSAVALEVRAATSVCFLWGQRQHEGNIPGVGVHAQRLLSIHAVPAAVDRKSSGARTAGHSADRQAVPHSHKQTNKRAAWYGILRTDPERDTVPGI